MKKFITLFSSIILFIVSVIAYVAFAHRLPYGALDKKLPLPDISAPIKEINNWYNHSSLYEQGDFFNFSSNGLLYLLGSVAALLFVFGLLVVVLLLFVHLSIEKAKAKKIKEATKEKKLKINTRKIDPVATDENSKKEAPAAEEEYVDVSDFYSNSRDREGNIDEDIDIEGEGKEHTRSRSLQSTSDYDSFFSTSAAADRKDKFIVPERLLGEEIEDPDMFANIETVVSMAQNSVTERQFEVIIAVLRPEYSAYVELFSEDVRLRISRQIMQHHMLGMKREEAGIAPGQFKLQDKRMNEAERETICRRFVPQKMESVSEQGQKIIGKVLILSEQQKVQQATLSQTEDWQDISLRNLVEVMQTPIADHK